MEKYRVKDISRQRVAEEMRKIPASVRFFISAIFLKNLRDELQFHEQANIYLINYIYLSPKNVILKLSDSPPMANPFQNHQVTTKRTSLMPLLPKVFFL